MKRLNPNTNKPFVRGTVREEDGFLFWEYRTTDKIKLDGTFQEKWFSPEKFLDHKNINRVSGAKRSKPYKQQNPHIDAANSARRRSAKQQRTMSWDPNAHLIDAKYQLAAMLSRETGEEWEVDHYWALRCKKDGKPFASGLHVFANLVVMPADKNRKKSNKPPAE